MNRYKEAARLLPARPKDANKGTFGKALIIAGSFDMAGAAVIAAESAYRAGAGLVKLVSPEKNRIIMQIAVPEALLFSYPDDHPDETLISDLFPWSTAILIGPGLSKNSSARTLLSLVRKQLISPVIYDADALNLISEEKEAPVFQVPSVLTPHIGEMSRLTGLSVSEIKEDRVGIASDYAEKTGSVVVLKDHVTVVAARGKVPFIWHGNNPGLSTGGSGDALAGIMTGIAAGGLNLFDSARLAVMLHGLAGEEGAFRRSKTALMARDIIDFLPDVLRKLEDIQET